MGRTGFEVEFGDADSAAPSSPYRKMMERLGELVDDVSVEEIEVAMAHSSRARKIEETRAWAVAAVMALPGSDSRHSRSELGERSFAAELAANLHMSEGAARNLIWSSRCLVNDLPLTLQFLSDGAISLRHAQILVDQVGTLDEESIFILEQEILPSGMHQTPPQFEKSVRRMSEKLNLESIVERQAEAIEKRTTYIEPMRDGMGRLVIETSMVQIVAIDNRLTQIAKSQQTEGDLRTLPQLKTDVVSDLLLDVDAQTGTTAGRGYGPVARFRSIRPTCSRHCSGDDAAAPPAKGGRGSTRCARGARNSRGIWPHRPADRTRTGCKREIVYPHPDAS
jgi:hypothetical protein